MLNEIDASNLSDTELKKMVKRVLKELSEYYKVLYGSYKELTRTTSAWKSKETLSLRAAGNEEYIAEMKNTLEGIKSRLDEAEDQISNLEDKVGKIPE